MNWDAIGAIGEIAGAVAVVITLIYVALQLRENTKSLKVQSLNETFKDRSGMMRELQSHSGLGGTFKKIGMDEELTPGEELEANWFYTRILLLNEKLHYLHSIGAADDYNYESFDRQLPSLVRNKFFDKWWLQEKPEFSQEFQIHINTIRVDE